MSTKAVILCGGLGTRLSEETAIKPKPMVEIGGRPILWHIMKIYDRAGVRDFLLTLGYKGEVIKDYFLNYHARQSNITVGLSSGDIQYSNPMVEDWTVSCIDTGLYTMSGGRLLRLKPYLQDEAYFCLTYGDGVSNVDIKKLLDFHRSHGKIATVTAVRPPVRFGELQLEGDSVREFQEKPQAGEGWINGGFFVFSPRVFDFLDSDETLLERSPMEKLAVNGELMAYKHSGFWQCMDTLRDKQSLEKLWDSGNPPWHGQ